MCIRDSICIASSITSKARIKLYKAQQSVISNQGRILYSDTDSIFASYKKNVLNETHGEVYWDPNKDDTEIKEAVFINPKTYGIIYKKNSKELVKMKGYNSSEIKFNELKKNFYKNEDIKTENFFYLKRHNFCLENANIEKVFNLNKYDKRVFINNKSKTRALIYKNFEYY